MIRVRFYVPDNDYRPISWPIDHPYWCTGYGDDFAIVVAYADDLDYISKHWPDAYEVEVIEECDEYTFTDRFQGPEWLDAPPRTTP